MCKKIFKWFLIFFVITFLYSSFTSSAAGLLDESCQIEYWECDGSLVPYTYVDKIQYADSAGTLHLITFDKFCYAYAYETSSGSQMIYVCNKEPFTWSRRNNHTGETVTQNVKISPDRGFAYLTISNVFTDISIPYFSIASFTRFGADWNEYFMSSDFVAIRPVSPVDVIDSRSDSDFALVNPRASISSVGVITAIWEMPEYIPDNVTSMPLLVDLVVKDRDTDERLYLSYPAKSSLPGANRLTYYDVQELTLDFNINRVSGLPENYRLEFVNLTPYYVWTSSVLDLSVTYKGQTSMLYIGADGTFNGGIQVLPDAPLPDIEDPDSFEWSLFGLISNFFSGFFSNLGGMLKDLFIPTQQQLMALLSEMEIFFSEKLGFLWFPFEFIIEIADALGQGSANSMFEVPPIDINILGGIHLYDGGTFDLDSTGIFSYVRFFTSTVLACSLYALSLQKWNEFIKGEYGE